MFTLIKQDKETKARLGSLNTDHGAIQSPFFMPVGTAATVKSLTFEDVKNIVFASRITRHSSCRRTPFFHELAWSDFD
jgi:tRNA-guanine family transglycosylase